MLGGSDIGRFTKDPGQREARERVKAWTRERFGLPDDAAVLVSEVACTTPGCPPVHTVVAFWTEGDKRHQFKLFKRIPEVAADDLPPAWLKNALAGDAVEGDCC
jgi:hypothetical protein